MMMLLLLLIIRISKRIFRKEQIKWTILVWDMICQSTFPCSSFSNIIYIMIKSEKISRRLRHVSRRRQDLKMHIHLTVKIVWNRTRKSKSMWSLERYIWHRWKLVELCFISLLLLLLFCLWRQTKVRENKKEWKKLGNDSNDDECKCRIGLKPIESA